MDNLSIVDSLALNAVLCHSWPGVVPPPSDNSFSYYEIKCWRDFPDLLVFFGLDLTPLYGLSV